MYEQTYCPNCGDTHENRYPLPNIFPNCEPSPVTCTSCGLVGHSPEDSSKAILGLKEDLMLEEQSIAAADAIVWFPGQSAAIRNQEVAAEGASASVVNSEASIIIDNSASKKVTAAISKASATAVQTQRSTAVAVVNTEMQDNSGDGLMQGNTKSTDPFSTLFNYSSMDDPTEERKFDRLDFMARVYRRRLPNALIGKHEDGRLRIAVLENPLKLEESVMNWLMQLEDTAEGDTGLKV